MESPKSPKAAAEISAVAANGTSKHENGTEDGQANGSVSKSPKSAANGQSKKSPNTSSDDSSDFDKVDCEEVHNECTFLKLVEKMRVFHYNIREYEDELIALKCKWLFEKDYEVEILENTITDNYPIKIIIPLAKKDAENGGNSIQFNKEYYSKVVKEARIARLRSRFVVPSILFDNKFICRSGTLTVWLSAMYERIKLAQSVSETMTDIITSPVSTVSNAIWNVAEIAVDSLKQLTGTNVMEGLFSNDVKVLKHLNVERICDLMIEYNKHYKQQVNVSSTEANEEMYKDIKMEEMPYPGCEFFAEYNEAGRKPDGLVFDWSQSDVTRSLELTEDPQTFFPGMDIENCKTWDLVELTKNYLKIMLSYAVTGTGGMVVHCISGWDRTPLFVSLLRLSLWADGVIHQSLKPSEMAYLTVAYDWFLFGHNLPDRLRKGEQIMHFCFNFLQHITTDEFSVTKMFQELPQDKKGKRKFQEHVPNRRKVLLEIRDMVLDSFEKRIFSRPEAESIC